MLCIPFKMFVEEMELNDWNVKPNDDNEERKSKSIQAYWLNNWYDKVKSITFETYIYNLENEIPDILPFDKCMVRYENKSPKDSEFWGPVSTKKEMLNLFYTSLRCKTNPGKSYCVRKWTELTDEYRCFWNNGLVAISSETKEEPPIKKILLYINSIKDKIFYNRCVFDIAHLKETNELIFVEFNSWESNSGAHRFNWLDDTEVFYDRKYITIRWLNGEKLISNEMNNNTLITYNKLTKDFIDNHEFIRPTKPSNWLVTDKYVYITNDIWLGRFDLNLNPLNWKRGVFRFSKIQLCEDGSIYAEPNYYHYELTPKKTKSNVVKFENDKKNEIFSYKYGIPMKNKKNGNIVFVRMLDNCDLVY